MYLISNQAMLFSMGLMTIVFYVFNLLLLKLRLNAKRIIYLFFTALLTFGLQFFADVAQIYISSDIIADLCALGSIYMLLVDKTDVKDRLYLKIFLLISFAVWQTSIAIGNLVQFECFKNVSGIKGIGFVIEVDMIDIAIIALMLIVLKKVKIIQIMKNIPNFMFKITLLYDVFYVGYSAFIQLLPIGNINENSKLTVILLVIMVFFILIISTVYIVYKKYQNYLCHEIMRKQEEKNLLKYTDFLEREQRSLRKFKHDYQNLMLSLEEMLSETTSLPVVETFKRYMDNNFANNRIFEFNDLDNVQNRYLKSVIINQIFTSENSGIKFNFECQNKVNDINIDDLDLVRILGIFLDNAREAALKTEEKKINMMIYNTQTEIEFYIENSLADPVKNFDQMKIEGMTSKKEHQGFGLANVTEIEENNPNLLINYSQNEKMFITQVLIYKNLNI